MKSKKRIFILVILCLANAFTPLGHVDAKQTEDNNVVLISFDGMRNDLTRNYVKEGKLPHIEDLIQKGVIAKSSKTITPSLTAPSHAAIATGATPSETGFVSNQWHRPDTSLINTDDAFQNKLQVNPLWIEARKQGKKTATVAFAGANPKVGKQADYSIYYGETWTNSAIESLTFKRALSWKGVRNHYGELKEAYFRIHAQNAKDHIIHVLAMDVKDDNQLNYNKFVISEDKTVDENDSIIHGKEWSSFTLKVKEGKSAGFWYKFKSLPPTLKDVKLYRTGISSGIIDGPGNFSQTIKDKFGFFPVQDDTPALKKGWITRKEYEQISERFVNWVTDVSLYIKEEYKPDLLMFYAPQIDHEEHEFLLTDPRQPGFTKKKSEEYLKYIEWSYKVADRVVGKTVTKLHANDHLFVVSDHGMEPVHTTLEPNSLLKKAGLLKVDSKGEIDIKKSQAYAVASSSAAHVYINKKARENGGIVSAKNYSNLEQQIKNIFKNYELRQEGNWSYFKYLLAGSVTNKEQRDDLFSYLLREKVHPYSQVIVTKNRHSVDNPHAGDILLLAEKGYMIGKDYDQDIMPAVELGSHGGNPAREKLRPVFIAAGEKFKKNKEIGAVSNLDIAPTVYSLLGIQTPSFVEGNRIDILFKK
ncbi:alkaline phosphatase family protein [Peribacillus sp. SCS-155]|uniref:alkaline phosphatase family protein n=1 Tax=Peribacillus sedimenti TaxID=3115297 RepID=UPI00390594FD